MKRKGIIRLLRKGPEGVRRFHGWRQTEGRGQKIDIHRAEISDIDLSGTDFRAANLNRAKILRVDLSRADLSEAKGNETVFRGSNLNRTNLARAELTKAQLQKCNASETNFSRAILNEADLTDADLKRADLTRANLTKANLNRVDLRGANLRGCNLSLSTLAFADLRGALLTGVNLYGTSRDGWKIDGVDCRYIYLDPEKDVRIPQDRDFGTSEFESIYNKIPALAYSISEKLPPFKNIFPPFKGISADYRQATALVESLLIKFLSDQNDTFDRRSTDIAELKACEAQLDRLQNAIKFEPKDGQAISSIDKAKKILREASYDLIKDATKETIKISLQKAFELLITAGMFVAASEAMRWAYENIGLLTGLGVRQGPTPVHEHKRELHSAIVSSLDNLLKAVSSYPIEGLTRDRNEYAISFIKNARTADCHTKSGLIEAKLNLLRLSQLIDNKHPASKAVNRIIQLCDSQIELLDRVQDATISKGGMTF